MADRKAPRDEDSPMADDGLSEESILSAIATYEYDRQLNCELNQLLDAGTQEVAKLRQRERQAELEAEACRRRMAAAAKERGDAEWLCRLTHIFLDARQHGLAVRDTLHSLRVFLQANPVPAPLEDPSLPQRYSDRA